MKIPLITFILLAFILNAAADIKPVVDPEKPLFRVFATEPLKPDEPHLAKVGFNARRPLLTIYTVRGVILARDQKGVMVGMNAGDTVRFGSITRKYNGSLLILQADDMIEAIHITAPIPNGVLQFKHPQEAAFAEYIRRRFGITEFKPHK